MSSQIWSAVGQQWFWPRIIYGTCSQRDRFITAVKNRIFFTHFSTATTGNSHNNQKYRKRWHLRCTDSIIIAVARTAVPWPQSFRKKKKITPTKRVAPLPPLQSPTRWTLIRVYINYYTRRKCCFKISEIDYNKNT